MTIHTGLSVTVCGYMLGIRRDDTKKVATVVVKSMSDKSGELSKRDKDAVVIAADLLASRAKRFLGQDWLLHRWDGVMANK